MLIINTTMICLKYLISKKPWHINVNISIKLNLKGKIITTLAFNYILIEN
jgi:hypothetical protein